MGFLIDYFNFLCNFVDNILFNKQNIFNKMIYKYSLILLSILTYVYGTIWTFNHIDAWIGIALFIVGLIFLINQISKQFKNKKDA